MIKKIFIISCIVFVVFILTIILYAELTAKEWKRKVVDNTIEYRIAGKVISAETYHVARANGFYVSVSSDTLNMFRIYEDASYNINKKAFSYNHLQIGDSIYKESKNSILFIYRNDSLISQIKLEQ